jgi:hypothetical protein
MQDERVYSLRGQAGATPGATLPLRCAHSKRPLISRGKEVSGSLLRFPTNSRTVMRRKWEPHSLSSFFPPTPAPKLSEIHLVPPAPTSERRSRNGHRSGTRRLGYTNAHCSALPQYDIGIHSPRRAVRVVA